MTVDYCGQAPALADLAAAHPALRTPSRFRLVRAINAAIDTIDPRP